MADTRYPKILEGQKGPNGHPVGYDDNGDYVEWIPADQPGHEGEIWPMIMRRNDDDIGKEYRRLWDKVWWNRHMYHHGNPEIKDEVQSGRSAARGIEDRWGKEFLEPGDDIEWGITLGKMMALAWVLGSDWDGSGDT